MTSSWLPRALEESRARGFLGPGAIEPQILHAEGFALAWEQDTDAPPDSFLDLGSGGGLPGLVLLARWEKRGVLNDSMAKRIEYLREVLAWPGAPTGGEVVLGRAEEVARWPEFDGTFDLVTARSFGPPSATAECAARLLKIGGILVVSEPPTEGDASRWSVPGLALMGLSLQARVRHGANFQIIRKETPTPADYPRSIGTPAKRPLF